MEIVLLNIENAVYSLNRGFDGVLINLTMISLNSERSAYIINLGTR